MVPKFIACYTYCLNTPLYRFFHIFPLYSEKIYSVRKKSAKYNKTLFLITESDVWKINPDQVNNYLAFPKKKEIIRGQSLINQTSKVNNSGIFLKTRSSKLFTLIILLSSSVLLLSEFAQYLL